MATDLTGQFVLPDDVHLTPVADLSEQLQATLSADADSYALTRPNSRVADRLLSRHSAELLGAFRQPRRIVDVVLDYAELRGVDPDDALWEAYPLLQSLIDDRVLINGDDDAARATEPTLRPGERVGGATIVRLVHLQSDTEVYQARTGSDETCALKIVRTADDAISAKRVRHEASILQRLDGVVTPGVIGEGSHDGRAFLVQQWCTGVAPTVAAAELRHEGADRARLMSLVYNVAAAYAELHDRGVVHGDVHPGNILVAASGRITLLDFGFAREVEPGGDHNRHHDRAGVAFCFDPEYAQALAAGLPRPSVTPASEQYSVAALLYQLATGERHLRFSAIEAEVWRQIAAEPAQTFAAAGVAEWSELETILLRALATAPDGRHESIRAMADALIRLPTPAAVSATARSPDHDRFVDGLIELVGPESALLHAGIPEPPTASVNLGAAGIAYGLYRIACVRESAELLALAELWNRAAEKSLASPRGSLNDARGLTSEMIGQVSPLHTSTGVRVVEAALAQAVGDEARQQAALADFVTASRGAVQAIPELALGRSGTLLGAALLLAPAPASLQREIVALRALGDEVAESLVGDLQNRGAPGEATELRNLGVAHGWAGILYALLRWSEITRIAVPPIVPERLTQLAALRRPSTRGACWQWIDGDDDRAAHRHMSGWCNGSAGFVFTYTLAAQLLANDEFAAVAEQAGWEAWDGPSSGWDLCCGLAGRAYALLALQRLTGDRAWAARATTLATRAGQAAALQPRSEQAYPWSLYRGETGLAVLLSELRDPAWARMPFFESEGWPHA